VVTTPPPRLSAGAGAATPEPVDTASPLQRFDVDAACLRRLPAEAQLAEKRQEYANRPNPRLIAPRPLQDKGAYYKDAWAAKVERIRQFRTTPRSAWTHGIYGSLRMLRLDQRDGTLREVQGESFGHGLLDNALCALSACITLCALLRNDLMDVDVLEKIYSNLALMNGRTGFQLLTLRRAPLALKHVRAKAQLLWA